MELYYHVGQFLNPHKVHLLIYRANLQSRAAECWSAQWVKIAYPHYIMHHSVQSSELPPEATAPISTRTVHHQLYELGFHGWAAAQKPKITMLCQLEWRKAPPLDSGEVFSGGVMNHTLLRGSLMDESGFGEHYLLKSTVPTVKFGAEEIMVWGCYSVFGLRIPVSTYFWLCKVA